jgi:hypothetical protein
VTKKPGPEAYPLTIPKFSKAACAKGPVDEIRSRFSSPLHLAGIFGWGLEPNLQKRQGANNILPGGDVCLIHPGFVLVREKSRKTADLDRSVPEFLTTLHWKEPRVRLSLKGACTCSTPPNRTGNSGQRSGEICGFKCC